jgi:dephospho-CoA kinase
MIVGLTGGIACGKSTVSDMLHKYGAIIIDADVIARQVVEPGHPALQQITSHFGEGILTAERTLDRKKLAQLIFQDQSQRKIIENILHPLIRGQMKKQIEEFSTTNPEKLIVVSIPLLFESELEYMVDQIMVVYVPQSIQIARLQERDQLTAEQALQRIQAQLPIETKKNLADFVIDNQGSLKDTEQQIVDWLRKMRYA